MAKKRSKKDRILAQEHRKAKKIIVSENKVDSVVKIAPVSVKNNNYLQEIFAYDPKLIVKDLKKTLIVVLFVLLVLLTIALLYT